MWFKGGGGGGGSYITPEKGRYMNLEENILMCRYSENRDKQNEYGHGWVQLGWTGRGDLE